MLGQRYEVAKQTTEAILETLSHNDYFNIMTVRSYVSLFKKHNDSKFCFSNFSNLSSFSRIDSEF